MRAVITTCGYDRNIAQFKVALFLSTLDLGTTPEFVGIPALLENCAKSSPAWQCQTMAAVGYLLDWP